MKRSVPLLVAVLLIVASGCRTVRIVNPAPLAAGQSESATRSAILDAMRAQSWVVVQESPGVIHAGRNINGKHDMYVALGYNSQEVSLAYEDSKNLKYSKTQSGKEYIHKNYNVWIDRLLWQLRAELAKVR